MKLAFFLITLAAMVPFPALFAQKHYATGDRVISHNRLISVKAPAGKQLRRTETVFPSRHITVDGQKSEPDWATATVVTPLIESGRASDPTSVHVLQDGENIYLFWDIHQPDGITAKMTEFDGVIVGDDYVQVDLTPWLPDEIHHGRDYYYTIAVNPKGVIWDSYFDPYLDGFFFSSWNSNTKVATTRRGDGWTVEMAIPFSSLDLYSDPGWHWQLRFHHASRQEGTAARVSSASLGVTVRQDVRVRRPALVAYYWARPDFMQEVKPDPAALGPRKSRAIRLSHVPSLDSLPDSELWQSAPVLPIDHTDRMGTPISAQRARARVGFTDRYLCLNLEGDGTGIEASVGAKSKLGAGMAAQTAGVNGVFIDSALFENECFWIILQPRGRSADNVHQNYYMIIVDNRGGVRGTQYNGYGEPVRSWKPGVKMDRYNTATGWGAEVIIDLRSLNVPADYTGTWGFNLFRNRLLGGKKSQLQAWRPTGGEFLAPSMFGTLENLAGLAKEAVCTVPARKPVDQAAGVRAAAAAYAAVPHPAKGGYPLMDIQFIGRYGWAVGPMGTVLRTEDGGNRWTRVPIATDADLYRVDFVNRREGWVAGGRMRIASTNESMRHDQRGGYAYIFHTTDGGRTWQCQFGARGQHLFGLDFVNENVGYAVGERGYLLKTIDGGAHWSVLPTTGTLRWLYGVAFRDEKTGFAVGLQETVIKTTDGGNTWRRLNAPSDRKPYGFHPIYRDVTFQDETGCIVGQNGTVLISHDGGDSWHSTATFFKPEIRDLDDLRRVRFVTPRLGYAVGELGTRLLVTEDGGASWSYRPVPNTEWLRSIWADDQGKIVIAGEHERILASDDRGFSWRSSLGAPPKADVLVMLAHGDDAAINLSPFYANYAINESKTIVDIEVMSDLHSSEYDETYNLEHDRTMWMLGVRTSTNFDEFENGNNGSDYYHFTQRLWKGEKNIVRHMVAAIRAYRPDIVIVHDGVFGDYDKPGHKVSGRAGLVAFDTAGGETDRYPELTRLGLQPWQPKKLYVLASESYPMTLDLAPIAKKSLKGTHGTCFDYAEYVLRNFQSQGIYHAENGKLSLVKSLIRVPEKETSVFDGLE